MLGEVGSGETVLAGGCGGLRTFYRGFIIGESRDLFKGRKWGGDTLSQCFSYLNMNQNHPEGSSKYRFLGPKR